MNVYLLSRERINKEMPRNSICIVRKEKKIEAFFPPVF